MKSFSQRYFSSVSEYLHSYQGSEKDDEIKGQGNSYTTHFRQLDPRIGRWLSVDPKANEMPWQSPYCSMDNNPVWYNDPDGDRIKYGSFGTRRRVKRQVKLELQTNASLRAQHESYKGWKNRHKVLHYDDDSRDENHSQTGRTDIEVTNVGDARLTDNGNPAGNYFSIRWNIALVKPVSFIEFAAGALSRPVPDMPSNLTPEQMTHWYEQKIPFQPRDEDIYTLAQWIVADRNRTVTLIGYTGSGNNDNNLRGQGNKGEDSILYSPKELGKARAKTIKNVLKSTGLLSRRDLKRINLDYNVGTKEGVEIQTNN